MLSSSPEFDAVVDSEEQEVVTELKIGWDNNPDFDGPYDVVEHDSITLERSLVGNLPSAVRSVEGYGVASLSSGLLPGEGVDEGTNAAQYYSRFSDVSPLLGSERVNVPVEASIGYRTDNGVETIKRFTGLSRNLNVRSSDTTASFSALDYREKLRKKVILPMIVATAAGEETDAVELWEAGATRQPQLNAQWIVDYILTKNGIYATPPPIPRCGVKASLLGSVWSEVGDFIFRVNDVPGVGIPNFTSHQGPFGWYLNDVDVESLVYERYVYKLDSSNVFSSSPGRGFRVECWIDAGVDFNFGKTLCNLGAFDQPATALKLFVVGGTNRLRISLTRDTSIGNQNIDGPFLPSSGWHYISVEVRFTATSEEVTWRVDGTTTTTSHAFAGNPYNIDWIYAAFEGAGISCWQIGAVYDGDPSPDWNDDFQPTAYLQEPDGINSGLNSNNWLEAILPSEARDSWDLLGELAEAEMATFFFDEEGIFRWWVPAHWTTLAARTLVKTVTSTDNILDIGYEDSIDQVRNEITVDIQPILVEEPAYIWTNSENYELEPGETLEVWANFEGGGWNVDNPVFGAWDGHPEFPLPPSGESFVFANTSKDGLGSIVSTSGMIGTFTPFATSAKIEVTNYTAQTIYFVAYTGDSGGTPGIQLWGRNVKNDDTSKSFAVKSDQISIDRYSSQPLSTGSTWIQQIDTAESRAEEILGQLSSPRPVLTDINIIADPRLTLGDRIRIVDTDGNTADGHYWITAITDRVSPSGYTQTITARPAYAMALWDTGVWSTDSWA